MLSYHRPQRDLSLVDQVDLSRVLFISVIDLRLLQVIQRLNVLKELSENLRLLLDIHLLQSGLGLMECIF